ncbi:binding-protein-dependent transport systems inner membrane component [Leptothrix cholodnii SP-6]|uniref:Binding-protein-dependent transport systems inner membrane component n=1 Tax=Leptothrix cholodnii (strain ATCC 51168 / LMG 8142 / SP-6) TaxID=395495 RepID=B1XZL0_LEPCP|nr:sugar ABC transporter permease [Leptothrix cholodnii]ACB36573.1 binding-protein-dependent transport systems inner membrane component [Leptothrix cholodnii SP-6]
MAQIHSNPKRRRSRRSWAASIALIPMALTVVLAYVGTVLWSVRVSFSSAKTFARDDFVGFAQYERLFNTDRWIVSLHNVALFGVLFVSCCLVIGFLLAVFIDQRVRLEGVFRTIFLYPYAMSFVATGLIWQWMLNPQLGIQASVRLMGFESFTFDWIVTQDKVMYCIVLAAVWQASGLVMAILLAGLRGVDEELWKAARIEGVPRWRYYANIVLPQLAPSVGTAFVLLSVAVVKVYDAVVAMTQGGPGDASEVPAKFIMDHLFNRANIGLASAASTVMLLTVLALLAPWWYARSHAARNAGRAA